jgi:predicted GNAT superfamily acetyltransferase
VNDKQQDGRIAYRKATRNELIAATNLLNRYYIDRLSSDERQQGFVAATFTCNELKTMNDDIGVIVAVSANELLGCLCCYDSASPSCPPPYLAMRGLFPRWIYAHRPLAQWRTFAYGPVVIHSSARGRGILRGLYGAMLPLVSNRYDVGTAFIAKSNQHSLAAHRSGLGMVPVGEFAFGEEEFIALAFPV